MVTERPHYRGIVSRLAAITFFVAAGCNGKTIQATNSNNQTVPACGGCVYTKADNPVLSGTAQVIVDSEQGQSLVEEAIRNDDHAWRYSHFQLTLSVTGGNASKGSMNEPYDYEGPVPWPSQHGDWLPSNGNPVSFPWEAHGVRVGYTNLTINAQKQESYRTTVPILGTVLRLDPKTILVPIQVAQLVPDYEGAPFPTITAPFDKPGNNVMFDDRWGVAIQKETTPDGIFDHITGSFNPKADNSSTPPQFQGQVLPDNVFRQCGIQFRLVRFRKVKVPKNIWEMLDGNGNHICDDQLRMARLRDAFDLTVKAGLDARLPVVMYTYRIVGADCSSVNATIVESTCGYNFCAEYFAAIATPALAHSANDSPYLLSHELGHILGLDDLAQYFPDCTDTSTPGPLMCAYVSEMGPGFTTTSSLASCATARKGAAFFSNQYFGTSPAP